RYATPLAPLIEALRADLETGHRQEDRRRTEGRPGPELLRLATAEVADHVERWGGRPLVGGIGHDRRSDRGSGRQGVSATGVWVVGTVTDEQVRELLLAAVRSSPPPRPSAAAGVTAAGVTAELGWWRGLAGASLFTEQTAGTGGWTATEDAFRLYRFFDGCQDDSDAVEELRDAVLEQFPPEGGEGLFAATARKANPFWALAYALGAESALQLPGWFGDFLLDSAQVRACLPRAEAALAVTGSRRRDVVERIHAWLDGLGDDPAHDADALLDGPLRVFRHAARTGQGVAGQTRWY
ncbi:hypothetical protein AB0O00_32060, partial [Kitasatospora sp. NPDC093558]